MSWLGVVSPVFLIVASLVFIVAVFRGWDMALRSLYIHAMLSAILIALWDIRSKS